MIVLIVDDSPLLKERLRNLIVTIPAVTKVHYAQNPREANAILKGVKPDVAIIDIRMPEGSGFDVLKMIKVQCPSTRLIMLTNYPCQQYKKMSFELGADYFFDKAGEIEEMVNVIRRLGSEFSPPTCGSFKGH